MTYFPLRQTTCFFIPLVAPCKPLLANLFAENNQWDEVFPALYGDMPKYSGIVK